MPADAKIFVNGSETRSTGGVRRFMSRGLAAGKQYDFAVKMTVDRDGTPAEETKLVSLTAGERTTVSFTAAPKTSLTLRVPADAKVWLAGNETSSQGATRLFETTTLRDGQAWKNYEVRLSVGSSDSSTVEPAARSIVFAIECSRPSTTRVTRTS